MFSVPRVLKALLGQTKDYKNGICCFSTKHTALRRKGKNWLVRNQDNVYEWRDMFTADCCTMKIELSLLVYYKTDIVIISSNVIYFRHDIAEHFLIWC